MPLKAYRKKGFKKKKGKLIVLCKGLVRSPQGRWANASVWCREDKRLRQCWMIPHILLFINARKSLQRDGIDNLKL